MKDATTALRIKPDSSRAIIARGEALYSMGEFEQGLLEFQRGWRARPHPMMKIGLQKCKDAIANAIGPNAKDFDVDLVEKVVASTAKDKDKKERLQSAEHVALMSEKKKILLRRRREAERQKVDKLLLGNIAVDATFLRGLAGIAEDKEEGKELTACQECIIKIAREALNYLEKRKTFWQQIAARTD